MKIVNSLCFFFLLFISFSCHNREQIVDQRTLSNYDFRLFQETPAWELAKAVEDEDESRIREILSKNHSLVNYQSPKYGVTVLHLAVSHHNVKSVKCLLSLNADVNIRDKENGDTPINNACFASYAGDAGIKILKMLIENGANINVVEVSDSSQMPCSPLMSACYDGFKEGVAMLISKGADVNYKRNNEDTALSESLLLGHYEIAYYLLLHGANYTTPIMYKRDYSNQGKGRIVRRIYIKEALEEKHITYSTPERAYYYKIVDFLKKKGIIINESGKRKFDFFTLYNELKELRE